MGTWWIPSTDDNPTVVWVGLDGVNDLSQLVHSLAGVVGMHVNVLGTKVSPLEAINRTKVT